MRVDFVVLPANFRTICLNGTEAGTEHRHMRGTWPTQYTWIGTAACVEVCSSATARLTACYIGCDSMHQDDYWIQDPVYVADWLN